MVTLATWLLNVAVLFHMDPTYFHTYEINAAPETYVSTLISRSNTVKPIRVTIANTTGSSQRVKVNPVYQDGSGCTAQFGAHSDLSLTGNSTAQVETLCTVQPNSKIGDDNINEIMVVNLPGYVTQTFDLSAPGYSAPAGKGFAVESENSTTMNIAVTWEWSE